jgi:hypothetical protein
MRTLSPILIVLLSASSAIADGGVLRVSRRCGTVRLSVFTSPTPPRAGPLDVSVLVQEASSGKVLLGVPVTVRAVCLDAPGHEVSAPASGAHATNKLLHAAVLELDRPGRWRLAVEAVAGGRAEVSCDIEVAAPLPSWRPLALWIGWPAVVVALFVAHRVLVRFNRPSRSAQTAPAASGRAPG